MEEKQKAMVMFRISRGAIDQLRKILDDADRTVSQESALEQIVMDALRRGITVVPPRVIIGSQEAKPK